MDDVDEYVLVESENENVEEIVNQLEDEIVDMDASIVPKVGMAFKDKNEMFDFYKAYAYKVGFPVRKRNSKKDEDGTLKYITFTCSREGKRIGTTSGSLKPHPTIQTGCKARISASSDIHGSWRINTVYLEHNHRTSPTKSRLYRCNRELSAHGKRKLQVNDLAGIPLHKSYNSAVVEAGRYDNMTCIEKDCQNYIEKVRRLRLGVGDAAALQSYFSTMQSRCSGFYFSMDLDDDSHLRNVFWADNRSRQAFKEFGDVVTFDTTYLTNKYEMSFAPFVSVNHHGQSTLLGCGLVSNEDTETFVWLFTEWLKCMNGKAPHGIITDQDRAMQNAIQIVFPNTKHRWCLWHILKKLPEKFGYHVDKASIFSTITGLVYDSQEVAEFEESWVAMIESYELHDNTWLSSLYQNRGRWVPCFLKSTFWAGMSTTQRSEGMNAFFDGFVHSKTSLRQFVEQYERALRKKVENEFQADFRSFSQMLPCATTYDLEAQFQSVYTISKFREIQNEFTGKVYCDVLSSSEGLFGMTYHIREDVLNDQCRKKKFFKVTFRGEDCEISCSCKLFEFSGIICRHAIAILIRNDITSLPEWYILHRWRRDVCRAHSRVAVNYDGLVSSNEQLRYDRMCQAFALVADLAANDDGRTRAIMEWIEIKSKELAMPKSIGGSNTFSQANKEFAASQHNTNHYVLDPTLSRRKGAPKKLRRKGPLEAKKASSKGITRKRQTSNKSTECAGAHEQQPMSAENQYSMSPQLTLSQISVSTPFVLPQHGIPASLSYLQCLQSSQGQFFSDYHPHSSNIGGTNYFPDSQRSRDHPS